MTDDRAQFESRESAVTEGVSNPQAGLVKMWIAAIDAADKEEKDWRKEADEIVQIYRSEHEQEKNQAFNILYSNTETALPAVYNSTPVPDIRRRYNDPGPAAKAVADMLERAISFSVDQYDFDAVVRASVFDGLTAGRGVARVRYSASTTDDQVVDQLVTSEYVPWKNFRRGPGLVWDDVEWVAFKHYLSREQLVELAGEEIGNAVELDHDTRTGGEPKQQEKDGALDPSEVFLRACVWEIWDRMTKQVLFIAPCYEQAPIRAEDDPLQLTGFLPVPRPIQPLDTPCDLIPVPPYRAYKHLAEELNEVTTRIKRLVRQIRVRGMYASSSADVEQIIRADDGELVPVVGLEAFIDGGGLEKAIAWWPIDPQVNAIQQLVAHREQIKTTIYEVSGLADIMRGNSNAQETLGAQQIKAQWGSLRIQRVQADVQRFCRDLFRMKAELIAQNFDLGMLQEMTGIKLASQQEKMAAQQQAMQAEQMQQPPPPELEEIMELPTTEEVEQIMRSDLVRAYRIDVESDSTVRADLTRNQQQMVEFVQGTAGYIQAIAPAIQGGLIPPELALTIYGAFARNFKLGRQVDVALEKAAEDAQEAAKQPPQPPPPDPAMVKAETDAKIAEAKLQMDAKASEQKMAMDQQTAQQQMALSAQTAEQNLQLELMKIEKTHELEMLKLQNEFALKEQELRTSVGLKEAEFELNSSLKQEEMGAKLKMQAEDKAQKDHERGEEKSERSREKAGSEQSSAAMAAALAAIAKIMETQNKPKRVVRDKVGRVEGIEAVE
jgi:hypothetical protein